MTFVLGIETSCDDTAAAVLRIGADGRPAILANDIATEHARHAPYGGVVPEIAARSHVEKIDEVIRRAMATAQVAASKIDIVAATAGPGLIGGVMVGLTAAKGFALAQGARLVPVNHLEGHALTARLADALPFPYLLLLVSGGHTQLVLVEGVGRYHRIGTTIDDAAGEAFDKTAKLLDLPQPGGPNLEAAAKAGRQGRFSFPAPLARREGFDFSFSGLKTAVRLAAEGVVDAVKGDANDLAFAFQEAAADHLAAKTASAMEAVRERLGPAPCLVAAGGVAANARLRAGLEAAAAAAGFRLSAPPPRLCTDNGAMIAWAGYERLAAGLAPTPEEAFAFAPRARWPLAEPPAGREQGGGKRGPKA